MYPPGVNDSATGTLLQEARDAWATIIRARVCAAGCDDLADDGPLVLAAMASRIGAKGHLLLRELGITERAASEMTETLVSRGYLQYRGGRGDGQPAPPGFTQRGRVLALAVSDGIRAARWADFRLRRGDIIISAWPKSGMTWVQMICALLIFQAPDLPAPLQQLSPWLDLTTIPRDEVYAQLAAQEHRRFIKTHLPLSEIPIDARATYVVIARHPLDAAVSMYHQASTIEADIRSEQSAGQSAGQAAGQAAGRPARAKLPPLHEWLVGWIDEVDLARGQAVSAMATGMAHLSGAWADRGKPNVVLLRYEDMCADLEGQMRRLAAQLAITVPDMAWPALVRAATFEQMRAAADQLQPLDFLADNAAAFFHRGTSGLGRDLLTSAELARYYARAAELAPVDLLAWLHRDGQSNGATGELSALKPA